MGAWFAKTLLQPCFNPASARLAACYGTQEPCTHSPKYPFNLGIGEHSFARTQTIVLAYENDGEVAPLSLRTGTSYRESLPFEPSERGNCIARTHGPMKQGRVEGVQGSCVPKVASGKAERKQGSCVPKVASGKAERKQG